MMLIKNILKNRKKKSIYFISTILNFSSPPCHHYPHLHFANKHCHYQLSGLYRPNHYYQPLTLVANCTTTNYWPLVAIGPSFYPTSTTCFLIIHHQSPMVDHQKFLATVQPLPSSLATSHPSLLPLPSLIMHHNYQKHHYFSPQIATIIRNF